MEQPLVASPDVRLPLSCRPNRSNWGMAAFLGLFGLASFLIPLTDKGTAGHPADLKTDWIAAGLFCAFFLIPAILWAAWTRRASIIADKNGLHWRGLGRWRSAGWSDVTDYYKQLPQKRASSVPAVIETIAGRVKFDAAWAGSEGLQTVVVCRAANARPKEWGIIGTRPEDKWPRTFDYEPRKTRQRLFGFRLYLFALFALWAWVIIPRLVRTYGMAEWEWNVAIAVLLGILLASKGFIVCYAVRALRETLLWADRRITVCPDWIEFEDSRQTVRLFWPEMSD